MTTEQKNMLLELVSSNANTQKDEEVRSEWNDIYWQVVKIETED